MNWLIPAISIDLGFKLAVAIVLFIRYSETRERTTYWWAWGWFFFAIHTLFELSSIWVDYDLINFFRHFTWGFIALAFLQSVRIMQHPRSSAKWKSIIISLIITVIVCAYAGVYIIKGWFWSVFPITLISGGGLLFCAYYFCKVTKKQKNLATVLIFLGFLLNGLHNLDYPFLRPIVWFAPIGFSLGAVFALMFAIGLILKSGEELKHLLEERTKELVQAHGKLVQSEKMAAIGQVAAAVAHELINPLVGIKMSCYHIGNKIEDKNVEFKDTIKNIEDEANYASKIMGDILDFSRVAKPAFELFQVNEFVERALSSLKQTGLLEKVRVNTSLEPNISQIYADKIRITQLLTNLITNAAQAMPDGGALTISAERLDEQIVIRVTDTGKGIEEEELKKIFNPFYTTKSRGLGLGLSITDAIVKSHKGSIEVESKLNEGTTFIIKLPVRNKEA